MTAAQRFSVLVTAKNTTDFNYYMHADMDTVMFDTLPDDLDPSNVKLFHINTLHTDI